MAKRQFNEVSFQRLKNAIHSLPGLAESLEKQNISLHKMQTVHVFGYGSLPDQPHYEPDSIEDAYLWGYSRDMVCKSVRSGTSKFPGLTLGLDKNADGIVKGAIMTYQTANDVQLCEMLEAFAKREVVTELPIYKFEILEIEKEDGSKVTALTCVADPDSFGYFGDGLTSLEKSKLTEEQQSQITLRRKAHRIAEANGRSQKTGNYMTCKSYFDRFVRIPIQLNPVNTDPNYLSTLPAYHAKRLKALHAENEKLLELAKEVSAHRQSLSAVNPGLAAILSATEKRQLMNWKAKKTKADQKRKPPQP